MLDDLERGLLPPGMNLDGKQKRRVEDKMEEKKKELAVLQAQVAAFKNEIGSILAAPPEADTVPEHPPVVDFEAEATRLSRIALAIGGDQMDIVLKKLADVGIHTGEEELDLYTLAPDEFALVPREFDRALIEAQRTAKLKQEAAQKPHDENQQSEEDNALEAFLRE